MKQIIESKDVNSASLLIPELDVSSASSGRDDPRLNRSLSLGKFITGLYKRIMCSVFLDRLEQLDVKEANMIDLYNQ